MIVRVEEVAHVERTAALANAAVAKPLAALAPHLVATMDARCRIAMSAAGPGSGSERNLLRGGFVLTGTTVTVRRPI